MKRILFFSVFLFLGSSLILGVSPYLQIAEISGSIEDAKEKVVSVLNESGYEILGEYQPGVKPELYVVAFTNQDIVNLCKQSQDRGMLAAAMKVGFEKIGTIVKVSVLNPEYIFYAYFREKMEDLDFKKSAISLSDKLKNDLKGVGTQEVPFGGGETPEDLKKYRYMAGMPKFEKKVELYEFESFSQGISVIRENLSEFNGKTANVYEIVDEDAKIAVFGVALVDVEMGEAHFLPIIGESHVAAMPYEIILEDNTATMLHGRFRFALHWPELTMGTFTKIMSSPGDVEDAMKSLME
jgi:hypothetical protein